MEVVTFHVKKKHILIRGEKVFDQKLIYARAVGLVVSEPVLIFFLMFLGMNYSLILLLV